MDAVSAALKELEDAWDVASNLNNGQGDFTSPALWNRLTALLTNAKAAADAATRGDRILYPPKQEQWLYDEVTRQHLRKGMTDYVGAVAGQRLFQQARLNAPALAVPAHPANIAATGQANANHQNAPVTLTLNITDEVAHHVCLRHTFTYFDFHLRTRAINTMWPNMATFANVTALAGQLAPHIAQLCLDHQISVADDDPVRWPGDDIELTNQPAGQHCVYFVVSIEDVQPTAAGGHHVLAEAKTFAPSGASGPGFMRQELETIGRALGILQ
ncbi:hypothetical protein [Streptomyces sp. NRRL S-337]|uniref:hypothetical protein n=1 Tax=Streptomyces sp. NRRL S-337 TaxID=1463900 RepID=UPI0004C4AC56|nr:hypothetical protein [Streptomyces sp. NRRL S-337]